MASIPNLVRPEAAFDPETIAVLSAALDEAWEAPPVGKRLHPARLCARYARGGGAADYRYGATGHRGSKGACRRRGSISCSTSDISATSGKVLREQLSRRPRFPRLLLPTAEKACRRRNIAWSTGSVVPQREFRPPHMALG